MKNERELTEEEKVLLDSLTDTEWKKLYRAIFPKKEEKNNE